MKKAIAIFLVFFSTVILSSCGGGSGSASSVNTTQGMSASLVVLNSTGVAPLAVFFDATATTDGGITSRPFHDLEYKWDFGDQAGGKTWSTGSQAGTATCSSPYNGCRNNASGAVAAHVYEAPGTYLATLNVSDGTTTETKTITITVTDPDALTTACVANGVMPAAGDVDGCPASASKFYNSGSVNSALTTAIADGAKRILFRRGDNFTSDMTYTIDTSGPGIIGAYGTGSSPNITVSTFTQYANVLQFFKDDWRLMDLSFDGTGTSNQGAIVANRKLTILRVSATQFNADINANNTDQLAVIDSSFTAGGTGTGSNYGVWCGICTNVMLLGNDMQLNTINSHNIRLQGVTKFVVSNSTQTGSDRIEPITIRGDTQYGVLSDNKFVDNIVTVKPQNSTSNEYQRDIIFERNWFVAGSYSGPLLNNEGSAITVRNNIFDMSQAPGTAIVTVYNNTVGATKPNLVNIYNNTIYNSAANNGDLSAIRAITFWVSLDAGCHSEVKNNLAYSPNTFNAAPVLISNNGACVVTGDAGTLGNSSDGQIKISPLFANGTPSIPADFVIGTGSYAHGSGVILPVYSDFFGRSRVNGSASDSGAFVAQ